MSISPEVDSWISNHRFCVTGGRGLLGSRLVSLLVSLGSPEVVVFDTLSSTATGSDPRISDVEGDLLDFDDLGSVVEGCDTVFHLAGLTSVDLSHNQFERFFEVNAWGTARVGQACREAGVPRIIYASTSHVYGTSEVLPISEDHPLQPRSAYAASKVAGEAAMWGFAGNAKGSADILRLANIYDARSTTDTVVGRMLDAVTLGKRSIRVRSFHPLRGFLLAEEAAEAFVRIAAQETNHGECGVLNISSGETFSIGEVAKILARTAKECGFGEFTLEETEGPGYSTPDEIILDNGRLLERLGWLPTTTLEAGLRRCLVERVESEKEGVGISG